MEAEHWKYEALSKAMALKEADEQISNLRDRLWKAEAEVKRLREQIVNYGYEDYRSLANRLAEVVLAGHTADPIERKAALAAWKEARKLDP
jgi:hypothetical protein